jgi:hypothetical protein
MADWQAIKTEYITTNTSYRKLAEKYGVSRVQIGNVGKDENWVELRRQHLDRTVTKTVAAVESAQVNRAKKMQTVADKLLNKIEAMVDGGKTLDTKAIRALTAAVKDLKEIQSIKSDLDEQEQRARIANLQKQADKTDDNKEPIQVILGDDLMEYSK